MSECPMKTELGAAVGKKLLLGRKVIYSDLEEITSENVLKMLDDVKSAWAINKGEIEYLYNYYKGKQPILDRVKEVRPEIANKVVENHAYEIVQFKTGYLVGEPVQYVSRGETKKSSNAVAKLNGFMAYESKASKDKALVEWQHICGTSYRLVLPDKAESEDEAPFEILTLDPRRAFVVYSSRIGNEPLAGVYYTVDNNGHETYSVYTPKRYFEIKERKIIKNESHVLGQIPIIEYPANSSRLGVFEPVIPILDAINNVASNRMDGIENFIQSLAIAVNCNFPDGTTANDIREAGMLVLKSVGENKADFKILSEQLNQSETQTFKDDLYETALQIVGMPSQGNGKTSDSSNNGAVILRNGWQSAEARAKDSELMFKQSEWEMLKLVFKILREKTDINLLVSEIDCKFTRRNYEDISTKANVLISMLNNDKVDPRLAFVTSGLFTDPEGAYRSSMAYYEEQKAAEAEAQQNQQTVAEGGESNSEGGAPDEDPNDGAAKGWSRNKRQVVCVETGETFPSGIAAERAKGIARGKVSVAAHGGGIAGGYHWKYVEQKVGQ